EAGDTMITPLGMATDSATDTVTPLERAPTMAITPSVLTSLRARSTPTDGTVALSSVTSSTMGPPSTAEAAAFSSSTASMTPLLMAGPNSASAPVNAMSEPTLDTGGVCADAKPTSAATRSQTNLFCTFSS